DGLPILAFLQFAIAMQAIHQMTVLVQFFCQCSANGYRHALPERARSHPYAGQAFVGGGMTLQARIDHPKGTKLFYGKIADPNQQAIHNRVYEAGAKKEDIFIDTVNIDGFLSIYELIVRGAKKFGAAKSSSGMSRIELMDHAQTIASYM